MIKCDFLIVGAGYSGATLASLISSSSNKKVVVIDKKKHIGGQAGDYYNKYGVLVHRYGPQYLIICQILLNGYM